MTATPDPNPTPHPSPGAGANPTPHTRTIGPFTVGAVGFGAWAIGGPIHAEGRDAGWGAVDDAVSTAAVHRALDLGVTFFDTAAVYGTGHSERVLGRALAAHRDSVVIATKFGIAMDEATRTLGGPDLSPEAVRASCRDSLARLGTDRVDLFQLHVGDAPLEQVDDLVEVLEELVAAGDVRAYGWSTDDPARAAAMAKAGPHCVAVQHQLNVLDDQPGMLAACDAHDLASINRGPLAMGLLTGKFRTGSTLPAEDVRGPNAPSWMRYFADGRPHPEFLARVEAIREVLTEGGRTPAQGALGWLLARSPRTVPIAGVRTPAQAEENAGAVAQGPLTPRQLTEIERLLGR